MHDHRQLARDRYLGFGKPTPFGQLHPLGLQRRPFPAVRQQGVRGLIQVARLSGFAVFSRVHSLFINGLAEKVVRGAKPRADLVLGHIVP